MPPRKKRGAVPGNSSGYGAERVSDEFFGDPQEMPDWARPDPDEQDVDDDSVAAGAAADASAGTPSTATSGPLASAQVAGAEDGSPATVEELRASMERIMQSPAPPRKAEKKKRSAKRLPKAQRETEEPEELSDDQWREKARAILLRQLTASDKSAKQLKDKLLDKECPEAIADEVIERFIEVDLVDDQKFADAWVRARTRTRGLARQALKHELRSKGVDDEITQMALEQVDDADEEERARELARTKLRPASMGVDREKALRRLVGMLGRKGYNGSMAFRVAREEWDARFGEH